jgi:predicted secreted protein
MVTIEQLAEAALNGESLLLRSLTQDLLRESPSLSQYPKPQTDDSRLLAAAASLVELFALRLHQPPPLWAKDVGALPEPIYLLKAAATMKRLRALCETESPEPLRKRGFYAPPNFLEFA